MLARNLILIEHADYWRKAVARPVLLSLGYQVLVSDQYNFAALRDTLNEPNIIMPVIFGCTELSDEDWAFVRHVCIESHLALIVVISDATPKTMRGLFQAGAFDVLEKSYAHHQMKDDLIFTLDKLEMNINNRVQRVAR